MDMGKWYCTNCGSTHVCFQTWYYPNSDSVADSDPDLSDEENCYCDDCEEHYALATLSELRDMYESRIFKGLLTADFLSFPKGTSADVVEKWFNEQEQ